MVGEVVWMSWDLFDLLCCFYGLEVVELCVSLCNFFDYVVVDMVYFSLSYVFGFRLFDS